MAAYSSTTCGSPSQRWCSRPASWSPGAPRAQDPYEIQVYDAETAARGEPGIELHLNHHLIAGASNTTFEPHYGLRDWLELGAYLQSTTVRGERPDFAGFKLRAKLRATHRLWHRRIGLAVNGELSVIPSRYEPAVYGSEVRPIADLRAGHIYAAVNPILAIDLGGDLAGHPQLEPAAKLAYVVADWFSAGAEAYGGFGPVDDLGAESVVEIFGVVDLHSRAFDLNAGIGAAHGTGDHPIVKLIFGMHP